MGRVFLPPPGFVYARCIAAVTIMRDFAPHWFTIAINNDFKMSFCEKFNILNFQLDIPLLYRHISKDYN